MKYHAIPVLVFIPVSDPRKVDDIAADVAENIRAYSPNCRVMIAEDFEYGEAEETFENDLSADISACCPQAANHNR